MQLIKIRDLPEIAIIKAGLISEKFLSLNITTLRAACQYIHDLPYGYNSDYNDKLILFKEQQGSCTMKHATAAGLAEELGVPLHKNIGVYKFTENITTGADEINKKYEIPYTPLTHCFLTYEQSQLDLTIGNRNGKKRPLTEFLYTEQVTPFLSKHDEYLLFKRVLREVVLPSSEMEGIKERTLLKARQESIALLEEAIQ